MAILSRLEHLRRNGDRLQRPAVSYRETAAGVCEWLVRTTMDKDWRERFPVLAAYPYDLFDYAREAALLAALGCGD